MIDVIVVLFIYLCNVHSLPLPVAFEIYVYLCIRLVSLSLTPALHCLSYAHISVSVNATGVQAQSIRGFIVIMLCITTATKYTWQNKQTTKNKYKDISQFV